MQIIVKHFVYVYAVVPSQQGWPLSKKVRKNQKDHERYNISLTEMLLYCLLTDNP